MGERNVNQRLFIVGVVLIIGLVLIYPPSEKLRPGLDIAGGTSLIFEVDTTGAENVADLAERVKTLLQKRVDPSGVYNLVWRVQGRNRIEVQMPLPPKDAKARREAYSKALDELFNQELKRGESEQALRKTGAERQEALHALAWRTADAASQALGSSGDATRRTAIEQVANHRLELLSEAAARDDALRAAREALARGPVATEPASTEPTTKPASTQAELEDAYRDANEAFEDSVEGVLATNLNRRRFQEVIELDEKSQVRKQSLASIRSEHADLEAHIDNVLDKHKIYRGGRQFLDSSADLKRLLRGAGKLEFRILTQPSADNVTKYDRYRKQLKDGRLRPPGDELGWFKVDNALQFFNLNSPAELAAKDYHNDPRYVVDKLGEDYYVLGKLGPNDGLLQGERAQRRWRLERARQDRDEHGSWCVNFTLDPVGGQMFETLTRNNIDRPLCILVDDVAYSAPNIHSAIRTSGQITGEFSQDKVQYLVQTMEGGTLPARLKDTPLSERTIGSSLGETNSKNAVRSGLIGTIAVIVVMLGYYFFCGTVAVVAMLMNVFLTLAVLAMLSARITLDGIAGLILSVGMAVDANVLIYERMREEKARGASLRMVVRNGYERAFATIFDSNMTTILTCVIIYYVGSEEVKGFGLTLGWGIALNLFTAVFVTRALFDFLLKHNLIKDVKMLRLIGVPTIDWYRMAKFLVPVTVGVTLLGVILLISRGKSNVFDIEFLGGVAAELELKQKGLDDVAIAQRLGRVAEEIGGEVRRLDQATVEPVTDQLGAVNVRLAGGDGPRLAALLTEPLEAENVLARGGVSTSAGRDAVTLQIQGDLTADQLAQKIHALATALTSTCDNLGRANVNAVLELGAAAQAGLTWNVTTTATNMRLFEYALTTAIGNDMKIQPKVSYVFKGVGDRPYPVADRLLDTVVPGLPPGINADLTNYLGGAAIDLEQVDPPLSVEELRQRLDDMHFQPDFADMPKRDSTVIGVHALPGRTDDRGQPLYSGFVIAVADPDLRYQDDPQVWWAGFAQGEQQLIKTALSTEQTLRKVMQFKPQIATRATQQAAMALVLSWAMIVAYVWIRFGKLMYGVGGVVGLIHDVLLALAFVGFSGWIAATGIGRALLVEDFKINMTVIAALLTIIGYSVNDTIVVFDRIRETRGRLGIVTPEIINASINQTLSRTLMTVFTVFVVIVIAYIFGGSSIRGFNYCMLIGVLTGCYSSIAICSPLLLAGHWFRKTERPVAMA